MSDELGRRGERSNSALRTIWASPSAERSDGPRSVFADLLRAFDRRAWIILALGFAVAFATGVIVAVRVEHSGGWANGTAWDIAVLSQAHRRIPAWFDLVLITIPWFATNITIFAVLLPVCVRLWRRARRDLVLELLILWVGNYLLDVGLKFQFGRPRPALWEHRGEYTWSSYPSGHAIATMSVLLVGAWLLHRERGSRWPFLAWSVLVGPMVYSRVYLGVHWPTDVAAGLVVGAIWGGAVWLAVRRRSDLPDRAVKMDRESGVAIQALTNVFDHQDIGVARPSTPDWIGELDSKSGVRRR
jgi:membrane-associated phospholipid phosphatase